MKAKRISAKRRWQTIAIHGDSGVGKTSLAATAPKPIFLDSNQGVLSVADRVGLEHLRSVDVFGMGDLDAAYDNFTGTGEEDWSGGKFQTCVLDHFDDIQGIILDELIEIGLEKDDRRQDMVEQREYGIMFNKLARYVRKFKRVPCHKILICGTKEDFDTGKLKPSLVGKMQTALPYLVDHTFYMRQNEKTGQRYLQLNNTKKWYAKTRAHWLPEEERKIRVDFNDPKTLTKFFDLIAAGPSNLPKTQRTTKRGSK